MIRGYVLFVPFPDGTELDARAQLVVHRRLLHSVGIQGHLVGVADDTDAPTPLDGIKAAVARMLNRSKAAPLPAQAQEPSLIIDRVGQRVILNGTQLDLSRREWQILDALIEADGQPVSAATLGPLLWPRSKQPIVTGRSYVCRLRDTLGLAHDIIRTARDAGWYFVAPAHAHIIQKGAAA